MSARYSMRIAVAGAMVPAIVLGFIVPVLAGG